MKKISNLLFAISLTAIDPATASIGSRINALFTRTPKPPVIENFSVAKMVQMKTAALLDGPTISNYEHWYNSESGVGKRRGCPYALSPTTSDVDLYLARGHSGQYQGKDIMTKDLSGLTHIKFFYYINKGVCGAVVAATIPPKPGSQGFLSRLLTRKPGPLKWDLEYLSPDNKGMGNKGYNLPFPVEDIDLVHLKTLKMDASSALTLGRHSPSVVKGDLDKFWKVQLDTNQRTPLAKNQTQGPVYDFMTSRYSGIEIATNHPLVRPYALAR